MLREVKSRVGFIRSGFGPFAVYRFYHKGMRWRRGMRPSEYQQMLETQATQAVRTMILGDEQFWIYQDRFYVDSDKLTPEDVEALVHEKAEKKRRKLERARDLHTQRTRRGPLTREIRRAVWERDGGRCVECGAQFDLQYDHILSVAMGGATTIDNLQLLCQPCNLEKSDGL